VLLFGRAGLVNQFLEWAFGIPPGRWFYGAFGVWLAQMFAFTPIAFMIMRGVVQGVSPSLEEASQTLRANVSRTFWQVTFPLIRPGLANAFLVGFIESIADFGNPIVVGGQFSVLSTEIFFAIVGAQFDQGRAATLAWILTLFALGVFAKEGFRVDVDAFSPIFGASNANHVARFELARFTDPEHTVRSEDQRGVHALVGGRDPLAVEKDRRAVIRRGVEVLGRRAVHVCRA
jgi:iron(III) transport system permease protein